MKKTKRIKKTAATLSVVLAVAGNSMPVLADGASGAQQMDNSADQLLTSPLLITEVVPNTKNVGSGDAYEFYELTNVSDAEVDLGNYDILYDNGKTKTKWNPSISKLPAKTTMLVWIKNDANTELQKADFITYYNLKDDALIAEVECAGLSNSGSRSLSVVTMTGKELTAITYNAGDSSDGKLGEDEGVEFVYDGAQVTAVYDREPSPFVLPSITGTFQLPKKVDNPAVQVTKTTRLSGNQNLTVKVESTNLDLENIVSARITINDNTYPVFYGEDGSLQGEVPYNDVKNLENFTYSVTISDGNNTAVSEEQNVKVLADTSVVDTAKAPALTITEILPDSSNINGADAYEYVEIYNNANQAINLKDYKLYYNYPDTGSDTIWWETTEDKILKPGETLVFWMKNGKNNELTRDDFNAKFHTALTEEQLIEIECGGMANTGARGLRICSNVKDDIDYVIYNKDGVKDTAADKSITYQNQYVNGSFTTVMTGNGSAPSPGVVTEAEKPDYQAQVKIPSQDPALRDNTAESFSNETETLTFSLEAASAETTVKTVRLHVKYNDKDYEVYNLLRQNGDTFEKKLSNIDLLNKKSFTYYFEVSDGFQTVTTEEKTIVNTDASNNNIVFNVSDGETLAGSRQIIAYDNKLIIDNTDVSSDAVKSLNGTGKIVFDASQTDVFFKNAVSIGQDVLGIFNEGTYENWATYVYDIDAGYFDYSKKTITVEFHAGNKANVLEHNIENNDDFVLKNIRMVLPSGNTIYPDSYQAKKGLGEVEHANMDEVERQDISIASQEKEISMGDGTSKYEILYVTFTLDEEEFDAVRYLWDTTGAEDGAHVISNGSDSVTVTVDNTAPEIIANMEEGKEYHNGRIEVTAEDTLSAEIKTVVMLDGKTISVPYDFRALEMKAGSHTLYINSSDEVGNTAEKTIVFTTSEENPNVDDNVSPENGFTASGDPTLSVNVKDPGDDIMKVTFKKGQRFELQDENITVSSGISGKAGTAEQIFEENTGNGFPYESFDIAVDESTDENAVVDIKWTGTSNNQKTFMYAYNTESGEWDKLEAAQSTDGEQMTLQGQITLKGHLSEGIIKVIVQNGEGYTPDQYDTQAEGRAVTTGNADDTPRGSYDFTFAIESDTQYYNEAYEGNPDQVVDGKYQYQLDIHDWVIANRQRMNIQYMFHDGDIIDDEPNVKEWEQADAAYKRLDEAGIPYGVLAGNHDVGHLSGDYTNYSKYFGESRYSQNPWYGESYKDNRGHYDLISVDGIDFIMIYMGWGVGDEEIDWLNEVLARYPERKAILNFHEYLLASGGLGEEPQRIHDEVVAKNDNVCMVFSGHYHNAYTKVDTFTKEDGSQRKVYNMLFDYQGLPEGGLGYMRLMHFDMENEKVIIRTYSPSLDDYDAKTSENPKEGNGYVVPGADDSINGEENFEISFADLGITRTVKTLQTENLDVNVYGSEVIGTVENVASGTTAQYTWAGAPEGTTGWYAEVTDDNGGLSRSGVQYVTVNRDKTAPVLNVPGSITVAFGAAFNPLEGVSASDDRDGDLTGAVIVIGKVDTGKAGDYELTYEVTDSAGNKTTANRVVTVSEEKSVPGGSLNTQVPQPESNPNTLVKQPENHSDTQIQQSEPAGNDEAVKTGDTAGTTGLWFTGLLSAVLICLGLKKKKEIN